MSSDPEPSGELSPKKNKQLRRPHASTRERLIKGFHGKIKHKYCHNVELAVKYYEPKDCGKEQSTQRWYVTITIDLLCAFFSCLHFWSQFFGLLTSVICNELRIVQPPPGSSLSSLT